MSFTKKAILAGILLFYTLPSFSQEIESGIYLTVDKESGSCPQSVKKYDGGKESFCITGRPLIPRGEFLCITTIRMDLQAGTKYADLWMTENSIHILKTISARLPNTEIVLVVDNRAAGVFDKDLSRITGQFVRLSDTPDSETLTSLHRDLKALVKYQSYEEMMADR